MTKKLMLSTHVTHRPESEVQISVNSRLITKYKIHRKFSRN